MDKILVTDIHCSTIVGINPAERVNRQNIIINLTMYYNIEKCGISDDIDDTVNYATITSRVCDLVENQSAFYTIEAMATEIARIICIEYQIEEVIVRIDKPAALMKAKAPGIEIRRSKDFFLQKLQQENSKKVPTSISGIPVPSDQTICYLGIGSNLGDRIENIHKAIDLLKKFVVVLETSFLYETKPQYIVDQPLFINAALKISTKLDPVSLLKQLLSIEETLGRQKIVKYGPRVIDLDILFYGNLTIKTPELVVPHPLIQERDFVLGPLNDIASDFLHPVLKISISQLFEKMKKTISLRKIVPLGKSDKSILQIGNKTIVMGVLNVTPDSFSDGGKFVDVKKAVEHAFVLQKEGCDVLDIGGQSTKPGAEPVSEEEELNRVLPVLALLKEKGFSVPISVDTFYAKVAKCAIESGASIINDVTGGNFDSQMFSVVSEAKVPIIITHSRGNAKTMSSLADYKNVTEEVKGALLTSAFAAQTVGIYKWHIIVDPGLGFAKHKEHSLTLLREGNQLKELGFPMLFGASKKGFLGGEDPSVRSWRTAAAVTASVQQGADIVRVHDVKEMKDVVEVADSIYRQ